MMRKRKLPNFCPNCGYQLEGENAIVEGVDSNRESVYDIYCKRCYWSGDIRSDHNLPWTDKELIAAGLMIEGGKWNGN